MFKVSGRIAYTFLQTVNRLDVDSDWATAEIGKTVISCLQELSREETLERGCSTAIKLVDETVQIMAWVCYKILHSLGLVGTIGENNKLLRMLALELCTYALQFSQEAKNAGLELDKRDGVLWLYYKK